jgi:hypothetical protein
MKYYIKDKEVNDFTFTLEPVEIDNTKYKIVQLSNGKIQIIANPVVKKIKSVKDFDDYYFTNSVIKKIIFDNEEVEFKDYHLFLTHIYNYINDGIKIIDGRNKNITNIIIGRHRDNTNFTFIEKLGISFQNLNKEEILAEIYHQCKNNDLNLEMEIEIPDDNFIVKIEI